MDEQEYILLEVRPTGPVRRGAPGTARTGPSAATVSVEPLSAREAAAARDDPSVEVAPLLPMKLVAPVSKLDAGTPSGPGSAWGVDAVGALESPFTGAGVTVAVLDTGIDAAHEAFRGLRITQRDFTGEGDGDADGHGTHCAGTIAGRDVNGYRYGVAPGVEELLVAKVLGAEGGSTAALMRAMLWALEAGADVMSMSLGLDFPGLVARWTDDGLPLEPATSRALEGYRDTLRLFGTLADVLRAAGPYGGSALVLAATGNESRRRATTPYTLGVSPPAGSEGFVAVGALERTRDGLLDIAEFSNAGATVAAPGVDILSARAGGGFAEMSGTSMAAPHAAGVAALWAEALLSSAGRIDVGILLARLTGNSEDVEGVAARAPEGGRMDWDHMRGVELELPTGGGVDHDIPLRGSPFPPIADYALLSDCEVCALVAPGGNVEWLPLPRMDGPSVFSAILDRHAGRFRVGPVDRTVPAGRRYVPGTMILETTWAAPTGWLEVYDLLVIGPWHHDAERSHRYVRAPRDHEAGHVLLRIVRCVDGFVDVEIDCEPAFGYGVGRGSWRHVGDAYGDAVCDAGGDEPSLRLRTDLRVGFEGPRARAETSMRAGQSAFCALGWSEHAPPATHDEAESRLGETRAYWHDWIKRGRFPDHPWQIHLQRSALTLKGLTYAPTGAMIAAATTSLPETPGGERNWDYRYSWLRDSTFMLWGLATLGFDREATDFFYFITDRMEDEELQIMYGIDGRRELDERHLDHLTGYEGASPVRVGNDAWHHRQHDVWGVLLDSVRLHTRSGDRLDDRLWPLLARQVDAALEHWRDPDRGIWEVRGEPKHFTSSKVFCWVAADRGARLARLRGDEESATRWRSAAEEIHAEVCERGTDARGVFVQHYDTDALDASLLLIALVGFLPPSDERVRATVLAIADELTVDGLALRYRVEATDDGLAGEEGTFTICSFWLVSALAEIGEMERARTLCEKLLSYASPLLLYAEEIEPHSGRHLGNFPQAFTHLALINAVMHIIDADLVLSEMAPGGPSDSRGDLGGGAEEGDAGGLIVEGATGNGGPPAGGTR